MGSGAARCCSTDSFRARTFQRVEILDQERDAGLLAAIESDVDGIESGFFELQLLDVHDEVARDKVSIGRNGDLDGEIDAGHDEFTVLIDKVQPEFVGAFLDIVEGHAEGDRALGVHGGLLRRGGLRGIDGVEGSEQIQLAAGFRGGITQHGNLNIHGRRISARAQKTSLFHLASSWALRCVAPLVRFTEMSSRSEAELIAGCRQGDPEAWDELFDRHYAATGRFIFQLGHQFTREDADEICQEVFLSVIKNIGLFQGHSQFQTWLFRIAVNKARDYRQRQQAAKRGGGQTTVSLQAERPDDAPALDPASSAPGPDSELMTAERAALLHQALEQLGEPCREIIELRYFGDLSYEELSRELDLNPKTVSSRLSKCLDRLESIAQTVFSGEKFTATPSNP